MKTVGYSIIVILFLLAGSAFVFQTASQAHPAGVQTTPTPGSTLTPGLPVTATITSPISSGDEAAALIWEGDPLLDDSQAECSSLRLTTNDQAMIGPCGAAEELVEIFAGQPGGWAEMKIRFAPFVTETAQSRVVFQGQGQITSPAWQRAIATWSQFTYNELASGRVSASARTVLSWWLGEIPIQPGSCRQLVVLTHGYAYSNITPCAGGQVQETVGGWLDTAEWDKFDAWLYAYAPVYQENNYFTGQSTAEMSAAEVATLAGWAESVYTRLRHERAAAAPTASAAKPTPGAGCPEVTGDTQVLQNLEHGYCLLYPAGYTVEKPNESETVLVVGSLMNVEDPRLHIKISAAEGRSVEAAADQVEADYGVPGIEIKRSTTSIGGAEVIVLDNVPGQDINRRVVFVHNDRLYEMMFAPASPDAGPTFERMQELYDLVTKSFTFLP